MSLNFHVAHKHTRQPPQQQQQQFQNQLFHRSETRLEITRWMRMNLTCVAVELTVFLLRVDRMKFILFIFVLIELFQKK